MKKFIYIMIVCMCMCACNGNNPSKTNNDNEGIYAPVTEEECAAIEKSIADNYDCFVSWLGGQSGDELVVRSIRAARQSEASEIADDLDGCFRDIYAHFEYAIEDGKYIDKSFLKERIYIVILWSKWKYLSEGELRDMQNTGGGNEQMYFDSNFNLIPRDKCECDCWIFNE